MKRLKSRKGKTALTTLGVLIALCIPAAQASAIVPTWHLGQVNLSEVGKTVEYNSTGTLTLSSIGPVNTPYNLNCQATGGGALGGESTLTLQPCETYTGGKRNKACDPLKPIVLKFSASMQSTETKVFFDEEECFLPNVPIKPGEMKLEVGKEAIHLPVNLSESTKFGIEPGSIIGSITMSLKAPFEYRGFGAGSAPLVHIGGKTLAELGKTEVGFSSSDSLTIDMGGLMPTFSCKEGSGSGTLRARGNYQEEVTFNCVVVGAEANCWVAPLHVGFSGSFEGTETTFATIHTEDSVGHTCSVDEVIAIPQPHGYFSYGAEAKPLSVTKYAETSAWGGTIISGESKWYPSGISGNLGIW